MKVINIVLAGSLGLLSAVAFADQAGTTTGQAPAAGAQQGVQDQAQITNDQNAASQNTQPGGQTTQPGTSDQTNSQTTNPNSQPLGY